LGIVPHIVLETQGEVFVNFETNSLNGIDTDGIIPTDVPSSDVMMPEFEVTLEKLQTPAGQPRETSYDRAWFGTIIFIYGSRSRGNG